MYLSTTQSFTHVPTVFGSGYVPEQHADGAHSYLPASERSELSVDFDRLIKSLRAMLSLR
jgi:hypothetical protein